MADKDERTTISRRDLLRGSFLKRRFEKDSGCPRGDLDPTLVTQAEEALDRNDFGKAAEVFGTVLRAGPDSPSLRRKYAYALYRHGKIIQARVEFVRVIRKGEDPLARLFLGLCQARTGQLHRTSCTWKEFTCPALPDLTAAVQERLSGYGEKEELSPETIAAIEELAFCNVSALLQS
ncbi:MAG: tetratricopeptide repeat protein [Desulfovibrionales bacterium]